MEHSKLSFELRLLCAILLASLPCAIGLICLMLYSGISVYLTTMVAIISGLLIFWCAAYVSGRTNFLFRTLSNLLEAMTNGDYSLRGRKEYSNSALGTLVSQINTLCETLARQRLEVKQQQLLLAKVIKHIDVAIVAINDHEQITLANPAAQKLLGHSQSLNIEQLTQSGKYNIHHDQFIEEGKRQHLWFITDVRKILRAQERKAWQNLIRVLSHEINNSLTPISSISQTLRGLVEHHEDLTGYQEDIKDGLTLIVERASSLHHFIDSYQNLSRLPEPKKQSTHLKSLLEIVIRLFDDTQIDLLCDDITNVTLDPVQFEQLLINLLKNAAQAMEDNPGKIIIEAGLQDQTCQIRIKDQGHGIKNADNLFVPFYTTKTSGSGTGLVLSRQIVEAHGGDLIVRNRADTSGCEVIINLPITHSIKKRF